jgi:hypothetical protein
MKKHKCYTNEDEIGYNLKTKEKDYFCPICQKLIKTVKVKK